MPGHRQFKRSHMEDPKRIISLYGGCMVIDSLKEPHYTCKVPVFRYHLRRWQENLDFPRTVRNLQKDKI